MIFSKIFALSLLLVCPLAFARLHLDTILEINSANQIPRTIAKDVLLDVHESAVVFQDNTIRVETQLVVEQEQDAMVSYTIFAKNAQDVWEIIANPELRAMYGERATLSIGNANGDTLALSLNANKI